MKKLSMVVAACLLALCDLVYAQKSNVAPNEGPPKVSESAQVVRDEIKNIIKDMRKIDAQLLNIVLGKYVCGFDQIVELNKRGQSLAERWLRLIPHAEYAPKQLADETVASGIHVRTYRTGQEDHEELLRARNNTGCPERAA